MSRRQKIRLTVFALAIYASTTTLRAQEPQQQTGDKQDSQQAGESRQTSTPAGDPRPQDAKAPARFDPSEKISEDLPVAFPADI